MRFISLAQFESSESDITGITCRPFDQRQDARGAPRLCSCASAAAYSALKVGVSAHHRGGVVRLSRLPRQRKGLHLLPQALETRGVGGGEFRKDQGSKSVLCGGAYLC